MSNSNTNLNVSDNSISEFIKLTPAAKQHFLELLQHKKSIADNSSPDIQNKYNFKIYVLNPNTKNVKVDITYCKESEKEPTDFVCDFSDFKFYIPQTSKPYLKDVLIDYVISEKASEGSEGYLTFKGSNLYNVDKSTDKKSVGAEEHKEQSKFSEPEISKIQIQKQEQEKEKLIDTFKELDKDASLIDKINFIVETEINPMLQTHGGGVVIKDVDEKRGILFIEMSGGCKGCSMARITLKQYIERIILENFPQLKAVEDVTVHSEGINPFY